MTEDLKENNETGKIYTIQKLSQSNRFCNLYH